MRLESYTQFLAHDRTTQGADEKPGSIRIVFGVLGIDKAEHVSGKFKDHVLKAAAGSKARYEILASQANGLEGARQICPSRRKNARARRVSAPATERYPAP
jgi:hypothetical protein